VPEPLRARLDVTGDWLGVPAPASEHVRVTLTLDDTALAVEVDAAYHADALPPAPAGSTDRLWEHEVVEVFLLGEGERYFELELGPHGHWLALRLDGVRRVVTLHVPVEYEARIEGTRWHGRAHVRREQLPERVLAANAYAMHGAGDARRHLAAHPVPGRAPDFHRIDCFRPLDWRPAGARQAGA
jgi:hypothetical protein